MSRLIVMLLLRFTVSPSEDQLDQLAHNGNIQQNAPVKASLEITVNASPERVWGLLTDIKSWPKWQHDITKANIFGPLQSGTEFAWSSGSTNIRSRIALVQTNEEFAWTGTAYKAKAIHVWKIQRLSSNNQTLVKTSESMDGFMLHLFYSSKKLADSDQRWLEALKSAAEGGT